MTGCIGEGGSAPSVGNQNGIFGIGGDDELAAPEVRRGGFQCDDRAVGEPQLGLAQRDVSCHFE